MYLHEIGRRSRRVLLQNICECQTLLTDSDACGIGIRSSIRWVQRCRQSGRAAPARMGGRRPRLIVAGVCQTHLASADRAKLLEMETGASGSRITPVVIEHLAATLRKAVASDVPQGQLTAVRGSGACQ